MAQSRAVATLVIDKYVGKRNQKVEVDRPSLEQVREAVTGLNGADQSSMCLLGVDGSVYCVGGGRAGYHVSVTLRDGVWVLCDAKNGEEQVQLIIGRVATPLPARYVVDYVTAWEATAHFYREGGLAPAPFVWVES